LEVAIVSNFDERLHGLLDIFGISEFVSRVFISAEVGFQKPEPEIFQLLLNHFKISDPSLCLHIGDNYKKDFVPAKTTGMHALLLAENNPHVLPADCIRSIFELNKL
jgi:putative hydrolase of the HAD superfamily